MKLLFVGTDQGNGGTESHFITLALAMQTAGNEVAAVVHYDSFIQRSLHGKGVKLYFGVFRNAIDPRGIHSVWQACREFNPDWIIGSYSKEYWPLEFVSRVMGVKLALFKHMDFPLRFFTHHFIPRLAHRFIVISKFMRSSFIARGIAADHIKMLYNPLDTSYFKPILELRDINRAKLGFEIEDFILGYVGTFHSDKGMFQLADALDQAMIHLPHLKMLWVGDGKARDDLILRIKTSPFSSRHLICPWTKDIRNYYLAMDVLAVPSVSNEAFGRVSLEAQACGVPVICSNRGGLPESINPGNTGILLSPSDTSAWCDAIMELYFDASLRSQMKTNGPIWVEKNFSSAAIAKNMEAILNGN